MDDWAGGPPRLVLHERAYDSPDAARLVEAIQRDMTRRYGGPDETPVRPQQFTPPAGCFLVGYVDGRPAACGGVRLLDPATAELKRMFVAPGYRRVGHARRLLAALEERARALGASRISLETGDAQPEAIALYVSAGYAPIEAYGYYRCAAGSRYYGKELAGPLSG